MIPQLVAFSSSLFLCCIAFAFGFNFSRYCTPSILYVAIEIEGE